MDEGSTRRGLLGSLLGTAAGIVALLFALPGFVTLLSPVRRSRDHAWQDVAAESEVTSDDPLAFSYRVRAGWEDRRARGFLVRSGDDLTALSARCTHLGCLVRPKPDGFRCPCHGGTFTRDGAPAKGPVDRPLERFKVRIVNGRVEVRPEA